MATRYLLPYEKQITSQHGEDGIVEQMLNSITATRDNQFLEIGWGDGLVNMTKWLIESGWSGVAVDAVEKIIDIPENINHFQEFVYPNTCRKYLDYVSLDCDFFSLDIDSFDYEIAKELLAAGFRPKTVCVEINKFFGVSSIGSFPYEERVKKKLYHKLRYSGVSINKWIQFWKFYGYEYFGYDSSCTNAFFYKKDQCSHIELPTLNLKDFPYQDNSQMLENIKGTFWEDKLHLIFQDKFEL